MVINLNAPFTRNTKHTLKSLRDNNGSRHFCVGGPGLDDTSI